MLAGNPSINPKMNPLMINIPYHHEINPGIRSDAYAHLKNNVRSIPCGDTQKSDKEIDQIIKEGNYHFVLVPDGFRTILIPNSNNQKSDKMMTPTSISPMETLNIQGIAPSKWEVNNNPPSASTISPRSSITSSSLSSVLPHQPYHQSNFDSPNVTITSNTKRSSSSNSSVKRIPRPANSFMTYRMDKQHEILALNPNANNRDISILVGKMWRNESDEVKDLYRQKAEKGRKEHMLRYPNYKYIPSKKKKDTASNNVISSIQKQPSMCYNSRKATFSPILCENPFMDELDILNYRDLSISPTTPNNNSRYVGTNFGVQPRYNVPIFNENSNKYCIPRQQLSPIPNNLNMTPCDAIYDPRNVIDNPISNIVSFNQTQKSTLVTPHTILPIQQPVSYLVPLQIPQTLNVENIPNTLQNNQIIPPIHSPNCFDINNICSIQSLMSQNIVNAAVPAETTFNMSIHHTNE